MTVARELSRRPASVRTRGGGISRLLVWSLGWMGRAARTMRESLRLLAFALCELAIAMLTFLSIFYSALGFNGLDDAFKWLRMDSDRQRRWASRTGPLQLDASYRSLPPTSPKGLDQVRANLADPARARDLDWHLLNPIFGTLGALLPWTLVVTGAATSTMLFGWFSTQAKIILFGFVIAQWLAAPLVARLHHRVHRRWVRFMLAGDVSEKLEERVRTLTATRMTALDMQDAEIQRIERDLHDGAQARLVTIGMTVTQASRLMKHDPDAALALLDDVKNDSTKALQELRTLVRGIRPPVLADRGLPDALRALAASNPIDTTVSSSLHERLVGSVESALFFAVSELMTNATKHSSASRIDIQLSEHHSEVLVEVFDDGLGGAEGQDAPGGGIDGIRRRLAPFDGTLEVVSPIGGGTFATIHVPRPTG